MPALLRARRAAAAPLRPLRPDGADFRARSRRRPGPVPALQPATRGGVCWLQAASTLCLRGHGAAAMRVVPAETSHAKCPVRHKLPARRPLAHRWGLPPLLPPRPRQPVALPFLRQSTRARRGRLPRPRRVRAVRRYHDRLHMPYLRASRGTIPARRMRPVRRAIKAGRPVPQARRICSGGAHAAAGGACRSASAAFGAGMGRAW